MYRRILTKECARNTCTSRSITLPLHCYQSLSDVCLFPLSAYVPAITLYRGKRQLAVWRSEQL